MSPAAAQIPLRGHPRRGGLWPWLLQRVSGLFLVYALAVHLWAVHVVTSGRLSWETITARLADNTAWTIYYALFIPAVVYHAANGVWGVFLDYDPRPSVRRAVGVALWTMGLGLLVYGFVGIRPLLAG